MYYSKFQRNRKIVGIMFELMGMNMDWVIEPEHMNHIMQFINKGVDYSTIIDLPKYSSELEIHLSNDTSNQTFMRIRQKRITTEDKDLEQINLDNLNNLRKIMNTES